ncbi:bifunctional phosphoribosylaminoimidazolecarboxamide formyltransferase/IMP cyclohydrolase [Rubrobacter taiwanensis]|uniref:Bifunctional purine biosynthesis protein PurH n=1 Tax=Rubrobacter taiwanensis TaxID=185139 RepID=A0A4R1BI31_9ACTN|nr:bifunctional phosphoribosylaminoimidazolecarboxamide formyltransferase/IMP cyclohydrolase [Rubrobacter taiwanensis]TCJ16920.1 bifunctional phosphoribosylaminoimidazolecarboxamide formyltransferase/IMP cyclohydrolase [Rubrobacter taiwanensis]
MKRRALVSVSDKAGVAEFARGLCELGFEIVSTGGTARTLKESGVPVTPVSEVTGAPEILGGRVKTLHPKIHGGILADRSDPGHLRQLEELGIRPVELVCINLYPFEKAVEGGAEESEAVEQIDIGGPAMLRAAAKNFRSVAVVPSPEFYAEVLGELRELGEVSSGLRKRLALAAFRRTAAYDARIAGWLAGEEEFPEVRLDRYERVAKLRYGENPHQRAAYYAGPGGRHLLSDVEQLQGRELSFNNLYDVDAARTLLAGLGNEPAAVIVKHANPCGAAVGTSVEDAYRKALDSDRVSAFGGIVALNGAVSRELAEEISEVFTEVLVAPEFAQEAREVFARKENMILLRAGRLEPPALSAKHVTGGMLLQTTDRVEDASGHRTVTRVEPTPEQSADLLFAWRVAKQVKSNAVVLARNGATVGIGAGQMSRVDAAEIAVRKAGGRARGAVAASDAFFPFPDGVETLAGAGVAAIIQPGGSKRDDEVVTAADRLEVPMVFTGHRHFLH